MKIGIDIRTLKGDNKVRGIGTYVYNLVENLLEQGSKNEYILFIPKEFKDEHIDSWFENLKRKGGSCIRFKELPIMNCLEIKNQIFLHRLIRAEKIDIFHSPVQGDLPWFRPYKSIVTVHDLVQLKFPETYLRGTGIRYKLRYFAKLFATSRASRLIAISESTKKDIMKYLKVPEHRISVIHNGVSDNFRPIADNKLFNELKARYQIKGRFIMYTGSLEERKNIVRILKAFNRVIQKANEDTYLLMAGKIDSEGEMLIKKIKEANLIKNVIFTGFVNEEELVSFYNACEFFVFPSIYEGFGLPALEAMACGKTLVSSNNSSLREIVGDAGYCVNPYSENEIAEGIYQLLINNGLRRKLEGKALDRAKNFSWRKTAQETLKAYEEARKS